MKDSFGRTIDYLRVALTDRCNLKCWYCRGRTDEPQLSADQQLRHDEFVRVLRVAVERLGIIKIRLTGGEPLLYERLEELIKTLRGLGELQELTLTTNGLLLAEKAPMLRRAGLHRVNVSLEGASDEVYQTITGKRCLRQVLNGLDALLKAGFEKPKLNMVLCRSFSRSELLQLLEIGQRYAGELRFIELMGHAERNSPTVDDMVAEFSAIGTLTPCDGRGTATRRYAIEGYDVVLGMIPSRTDKFCAHCRRIRLVGDGQLRTCLFSRTGAPLREKLRGGCSDDELARLMRNAVLNKPSCAVGDEVTMCQVGG